MAYVLKNFYISFDQTNERGIRDERNDESQTGDCFVGPEFPTLVEIEENQVKYQVDVKDGQKTGFFLDQKYNRRAVARLAAGHTVLDCFTHTGSFALNARWQSGSSWPWPDIRPGAAASWPGS